MPFWSDETLGARLASLIKPFSHSNINCASYELHVGNESYVTPVYDAKLPERAKRKLQKGDSLVIPKGQFAFLITEEDVSVPDDAVAFISIKAKIKFRGLINISGFHVDPGYSGKLIFSVYNAGGGDVLLECGGAAFVIWYASLDKKSSKPKTNKGYQNIPVEMLHGLNNDIFSLPTFDSRLKEVEKKLDRIVYIATAFATIISIFLLILRYLDYIEKREKNAQPQSIEEVSAQTTTNEIPAAELNRSSCKNFYSPLIYSIKERKRFFDRQQN